MTTRAGMVGSFDSMRARRSTPTRPTIEPTDRSMLRVRTTSVWPTATTAIDGHAGADPGERPRATGSPGSGWRRRHATAMMIRTSVSSRSCSGRTCGSSTTHHAVTPRRRRGALLAHRGRQDPLRACASARPRIAICRPSRITRIRSLIASTSGRSELIRMIAIPSCGELVDQLVHLDLGADVDARAWAHRGSGRADASPAICSGRPSAGCRPTAWRPAPRPTARGCAAVRGTFRGRAPRPIGGSARSVQVPRERAAARCSPRSTAGTPAPARVGPRSSRRSRRRSASCGWRIADRLCRRGAIVPVSAGAMPNRARPTSVRRAPTSPAKPSTSPARSSNDTSLKTPSRPSPRTSRTTLAGLRRRPLEAARLTVRPTISRIAIAGVSSRPGSSRYPAAVAQDGHPVGDLEDLLHPVRDEQDRDALAPEDWRRSGTADGPRGRRAKPSARP